MSKFARFIKYIKDIIDEKESPSFGRASAAVVVGFILIWECYIVCTTSALSPLDWGWVGLVGTLWGGSNIKEAYVKGKEIVNGLSKDN